MTDKTALPHGVYAKRDRYGRGWVGVFHGEHVGNRGTRQVRDASGAIILYDCEKSAEMAATRALFAALDRADPPRSKATKTFTAFGQGRNRKMVQA